MPRNARCVLLGLHYQVTQRGTNREDVFHSQQDREVYLSLATEHLQSEAVQAVAFCLMTNHVHWIVKPREDDALATYFQRLHER